MSNNTKKFSLTFTLASQALDVHVASGTIIMKDTECESKARCFWFRVFHPLNQTLRQIFIHASEPNNSKPIISLLPTGEIHKSIKTINWKVTIKHSCKGGMANVLVEILIQTLSFFIDGVKETAFFEAGFGEISATRVMSITATGEYGAEKLFELMLES